MAIRQRGTRWQVDVKVGKERIRRSVDGSYGDAEKAEAALRLQLLNGASAADLNKKSVTTGDGVTFGHVVDRVMERHYAGMKSEAGAQKNAKAFKAEIGASTPITDVTTERVDALVDSWVERGNTGGTINRKLAFLSVVMKYAKRRGWVRETPSLDRKRESDNRVRWLSIEEEQKFVRTLKTIEKHDVADLVTFLIDTGLRVGEAFKLRWPDVREDAVFVEDRKNGTSTLVPLTTRAKAILEARRRREDLVGRRPWPMGYWELEYAWKRARELIGMDKDEQFVPHVLRHTFASRLVQAGVPLNVVKDLLGHKTIHMTLRYAHLAPDNYADAIGKLEDVIRPTGGKLKLAV